MTASPTETAAETAAPDVLLVGAGAVGLALGIALARAGLQVALAGVPDTRPTGRTVALLEGSVALLTRLGAWDRLAPEAEPLRVMRLVDATDSLFRGPPIDFRASEIGRSDFGRNIENHRLVAILAEAAASQPGLVRLPVRIEGYAFGPDRARARDADGFAIAAPLVVATDGRGSTARAAAGITVRETRYPQDALTATLEHTRPHRGVSTEFHTRQGPFTLVPLPSHGAVPHRASLVWGMSPEDADRRQAFPPERFARDIERQSEMLLGRITVAGPVGRFPVGHLRAERLIGRRIALAGEAAHAMAPIGAQGLNLSLRDVASLADILGRAKTAGEDLGGPAVLDRYARARDLDVSTRAFGVDRLNRSLLDRSLPGDAVRGAGFLALASIGPLRRFAMRQGLMPGGDRDRAAPTEGTAPPSSGLRGPDLPPTLPRATRP